MRSLRLCGDLKSFLFSATQMGNSVVLLCHLLHFQTFMGTEGDTAAAVDTDKGLTGNIQIDCIHRTGVGTFPTAYAQGFFNYYPTAFTLSKSSGGTYRSTGGWIAGQTGFCLKAGGESSGRDNANSCGVPGEAFMHLPRTCQGTGVAANTPFH